MAFNRIERRQKYTRAIPLAETPAHTVASKLDYLVSTHGVLASSQAALP